jgi:hypothetical protein
MAQDYFAEEINTTQTKDYFSSEITKGKTQSKTSPIVGLGRGVLDVVRSATRPLVETSAHTLQGIEGLAKQAMGREPTMRTYDVPFYGEIPPIQNIRQAAGNALQTSASLIPTLKPALAGAMFSGGGALSKDEGVISTAINTALGAIVGQVASSAMGLNKAKLMQQAGNIYRKIIRPTASEIKKIDIGKGGDINTYFQLAAKEKLPVKLSQGRLDTTDAISMLQTKQSTVHEQLNQQLAKDTTKRFNLNNIRQKAKLNASKGVKNARELETIKNNIDEFIDAEINRLGGDRFVNAQQLNEIKQGMWSVSYNPLDPAQNIKAESARKIGQIAKTTIEKYAPSSSIQSLNKLSGDYATLQRLLENAHGRSSGTLVKEGLGRLIGGMAGAATPHPIMGAGIGQAAGGKIVNLLNNPDIATKFAQWKMSRGLR